LAPSRVPRELFCNLVNKRIFIAAFAHSTGVLCGLVKESVNHTILV